MAEHSLLIVYLGRMQPKATYKTSFSSSLSSPPSLSIMKQSLSLLPALMLCYSCLCTEHRGPLLCRTNSFGSFSTILKPFCLFCLIFTFTYSEIGMNVDRKCAEKYCPSPKSTWKICLSIISAKCTLRKKGRSAFERRKSI